MNDVIDKTTTVPDISATCQHSSTTNVDQYHGTLTSASSPWQQPTESVSFASQATSSIRHLHKLEKKQSCGDLHSRLKTRKLLGVGETPDGDVHRSKLSQILGHNDQLYQRLPRGLRSWQYVNAVVMSCLAVVSLLFPSYVSLALDVSADEQTGTTGNSSGRSPEVGAICAIRLHGAALAGLSLMFWTSLNVVDRVVVRSLTVASTCYWLLHILVTSLAAFQAGKLCESVISLFGYRLVALAVSGYYCHTLYCRPRDHRAQRAKQLVTGTAVHLPQSSLAQSTGSASPAQVDKKFN